MDTEVDQYDDMPPSPAPLTPTRGDVPDDIDEDSDAVCTF